MSKEKFTEIYKTNYWNSRESVSGRGSEVKVTSRIRTWLQDMLVKYDIKTMLDCPCGDYNWMKLVQFKPEFQYLGMDIVDELIINNNKNFSTPYCNFVVGDITKDWLPKTDVILVKDLFLHLSLEDCQKAIANIKKSGSKYLIASNAFHIQSNDDITTGGGWRPISLQIEPFNFKEPLESLDVLFTQMTLHKIDEL